MTTRQTLQLLIRIMTRTGVVFWPEGERRMQGDECLQYKKLHESKF